MTNPQSNLFFNTGICEKNVSNRTYINLYKGLKNLIPAPAYLVTGNKVYKYEFRDVDTRQRCIILKGYLPKGISIFDLYNSISDYTEPVERVTVIFRIVNLLIKASKIFYAEFGHFPPLILNSIYIEENTNSICFISPEIIDLINSSREEEYKKLVEYCIKPEHKEKITNQDDLAVSICRLIYLFLSKNRYSTSAPEIDIRCFYKFLPRDISNIIWYGITKNKVSLDRLEQTVSKTLNLLNSFKNKNKNIVYSNPPLIRRPFFSRSRHRIKTFISFRRGLLIVIILLVGFGVYLITDFIKSSKGIIDVTGLPPEKIVEIYIKAIDELDVEVLETLFYKRAGRKLINEVSTIYVVSRLGQIYSKKPPESPSMGEEVYNYRWDPVTIENVSITRTQDSSQPVFKISYIKKIETETGVEKYSEIDTLHLAKIKNKWRIVKIERTIKEINK